MLLSEGTAPVKALRDEGQRHIRGTERDQSAWMWRWGPRKMRQEEREEAKPQRTF